MATSYAAPGVYVEEVPAAAPIVGVGTSTPVIIGFWADPQNPDPKLAAVGQIVLVDSITSFKNRFGDYTDVKNVANDALNVLGHAVQGFFDNGGSLCYVVHGSAEDKIDEVLVKLEAYDDISMVVAPGVPADVAKLAAVKAIVAHCQRMGDRIAILDAPPKEDVLNDLVPLLPGGANAIYDATDFAAVYTPYLIVHDIASGKDKAMPPSGHIAGIYARTDATRGVHKAPANEQVMGVIGPAVKIGRKQQEALNPVGGNCIRVVNGALKVWGARTLAGEASLHKYVPIRRLLSFLYKSIDHGTQWAVFEPNGPDLWARVIRNVSSFLTSVWAQGALAGTVPQEAFYVKCDAENNPPDERAKGKLTVEVGVATVFPAEFVVFKVQQYTGPIK